MPLTQTFDTPLFCPLCQTVHVLQLSIHATVELLCVKKKNPGGVFFPFGVSIERLNKAKNNFRNF